MKKQTQPKDSWKSKFFLKHIGCKKRTEKKAAKIDKTLREIKGTEKHWLKFFKNFQFRVSEKNISV